jgi:hypothetical protein
MDMGGGDTVVWSGLSVFTITQSDLEQSLVIRGQSKG